MCISANKGYAYNKISHQVKAFFFLWVILVVSIPDAKSAGKSELITYADFSTGAVISSGDEAPFWMWANTYGRKSYEKRSAYTRLRFGKEDGPSGHLDWFFGFDATGRTDSGQDDLIWSDLYFGLSYADFQIYAGKKAEFFGLIDPSMLSAGSVVYSRNAPPYTKIVISTKDYVNVLDWFAFQAYLAHGWLDDDRYVKDAYLHQKYLYLRIGNANPDRGFFLYAGFHDIALWGGEGMPSELSDFWRVFFGQGGGEDASSSDQINALGDHFGVFEYALKVKTRDWDYNVSYQTIFEDSSGMKWLGLLSPDDYMIGFYLMRNRGRNGLRNIVVEYLDTRDHGGKPREPDNYFDNGIYRSGWFHDGYAVGHPFIRFLVADDNDHMPYNRVRGVSFGMSFQISRLVNPLVRASYVENYGNVGVPFPDDEVVRLYSFDVTNTTYFSNGWSLVEQVALDTGENASTSFGFGLTVKKTIFD